MAPKKKVAGFVKLQIPGGAANPARTVAAFDGGGVPMFAGIADRARTLPAHGRHVLPESSEAGRETRRNFRRGKIRGCNRRGVCGIIRTVARSKGSEKPERITTRYAGITKPFPLS